MQSSAENDTAASVKPELDVEAAKIFYEFKYKTIMEATAKLTQFAILFFSISSLVTGFTVFNSFDSQTKTLVMYCGIIIVAVFAIIGGAISFGVIMGLNQIRETLKSISLDTYETLQMDAYLWRGTIVVCVVCVACALGVVALMLVIFRHT